MTSVAQERRRGSETQGLSEGKMSHVVGTRTTAMMILKKKCADTLKTTYTAAIANSLRYFI